MTDAPKAKTFEERLDSEIVQRRIQDYIRTKEYTRLALAERKRFEREGDDYKPQNAPEQVRDLCQISLQNVKTAVSSELCQNVENLPMQSAYKIAKILDLPGDQPLIPMVEALIRKYNLDPSQKPESGTPTP